MYLSNFLEGVRVPRRGGLEDRQRLEYLRKGGYSTWERGIRVPGRIGVPERGWLEYLGEGVRVP